MASGAGLSIAGLSFLSIFIGLAIATVVLFLYYVSEWATYHEDEHPREVVNQVNREVASSWAYMGGVIVLLYIISGMHAFVTLKKFYPRA